MKIAIVETILTPAGHEIDYDRILVEELRQLGHDVEFYVPEGHVFKWNYGAPITFLPGEGVSYAGVKGIKKMVLSVKREFNRRRWYNKLYSYAVKGNFDAILFPSATYRYIRALPSTKLLDSPVPVAFVIHGQTPQEAPLLFAQAEKIEGKPNIKIGVQTFAMESIINKKHPNISYFYPPNYIPRDIEEQNSDYIPAILKLGFFGQYRKEKNLDGFLDVFVKCKFSRPVKLIVQGATMTDEDSVDFERIMKKYGDFPNLIEFWHKPLIGKEWQEAIAGVDTIIMPYGAERYRYHTSAILSTAIGFKKSVIIADNINPEVTKKYKIGECFTLGSDDALLKALEQFVNHYDDNFIEYKRNIEAAYHEFAPRKLAVNIVKMIRD